MRFLFVAELRESRTMNNLVQFITAGNALFTLENTATGNRFTFRVRQPGDDKPHFVSAHTRSDNESDYTFLGTISRVCVTGTGGGQRLLPLLRVQGRSIGFCGGCRRRRIFPQSCGFATAGSVAGVVAR
jgi:hypothetical protein